MNNKHKLWEVAALIIALVVAANFLIHTLVTIFPYLVVTVILLGIGAYFYHRLRRW